MYNLGRRSPYRTRSTTREVFYKKQKSYPSDGGEGGEEGLHEMSIALMGLNPEHESITCYCMEGFEVY